MADTDKSELALTIKINRLMPHDTWCDPIERCSCGQESRRKDMLALITQQCNQARIKTAELLASKSVRYDINDPVIDLDNWATPNVVITNYIASQKAQAKETEGA